MADQQNVAQASSGVTLVTVLIALIFLFVWPGPFRFDYSYRDEGLVRIDRITGRVTMLEKGNYVPVKWITKGQVGE